MTRPDLPSAPQTLIEPDGSVHFGNFTGAVQDLNAQAFDYRRMRRWPWTASQKLAQKLFKRWQFVGAMDENFVVGAAVVHLHYLGSGFAYIYNRKTGEIVEKNIKMPLAKNTQFSPSPLAGQSKIHSGKNSIVADNQIQDQQRKLDFDFGDIKAQITYQDPGSGISTACKQAMYGFGYTYKAAALPAKGQITLKGETHVLSPKALALLDWSAATPPRETVWNWTAGVGHDASGRTVGINFSTGLVNAGYSQNTVWINGTPHMIGGVVFDYDQEDILGTPWHLHSVDGAMDLTFHPEKERYENVNFGLVASSLHQPFGKFEGRIHLPDETIDADLFGFCEEHYAKW